MDWFLNYNGFRHESVNPINPEVFSNWFFIYFGQEDQKLEIFSFPKLLLFYM